ncbi:GAGA-binding transcriptional activator [Macleaya cordata]|uniref:GAGA-binding transcriptional activator n=1 Tax=Macleaya cordata TaxID=56857 RepID=A0A200PX88_MACCD|nr:GAGA-binding transcriptional activator [Macleaya cordata]
MDEKGGMGIRNWDFSKQTVSVDAVLKPVSGIPVSGSTNEHHHAAFLKMGMYPNRNSMIPESETEQTSVEFAGHCWVHQRNFLPATKNSQNPMHTTHINTETGLPVVPTSLGMPIDGSVQNGEFGNKTSKIKKPQSSKKSDKVASKALRPKEPKKKPATSTKKKGNSISTSIREKKNLDIVLDGSTMDFSQVPAPVCSCTGVPRQCYRWGAGGWQSSCCTTNLSEYPLPMSSSRPGARLAGRKMSNGAYGKLLQRLAAEGYELSHAVDLKDHWAKHGTNKFVTIK